MNCIRQRVSALHVVALLTLFVLTAAAILPLQAQSDTATKQAPKAASVTWEQYGYGATHVGYNPKEKTLSAANVSQLTQTWEFPTNAAVNIPTLTSGNTVFVDSTDGNLYALNASSGTPSGNSPEPLPAMATEAEHRVWPFPAKLFTSTARSMRPAEGTPASAR
jgi:glucose dehydrogenase